ncbi:MAG: hypothetical protein K6A23_05345 [Butyrivibrio sp.]|nr:hypothetical protein [Butyrivibrio sp.]
MAAENKVYVGFGFHVNFYHSDRGDSKDDKGFGNDINNIRYILDVLDKANESGIPIKGTWDIENYYTLEKMLPESAPDIIERIKARVEKGFDENIITGYSGGMFSAMTENEVMASIEMSVSNSCGSGVNDLFGHCEMILRPQDYMFTPSLTPLYKKAGIKALCLSYSCTPMDAFRTVIGQLPDEKAFNPVTYHYYDDQIVIMPTYCHSDIMDAGSLSHLINLLHNEQITGQIGHDVFIFINMDADSILWKPMNVPEFFQKKLPNMNGLQGLITEVSKIDCVDFITPGKYIAGHGPLTDISFNEDVASGNYTGYSSWGERPFNRQIWTKLERARAIASLYESDKDSPSFDNRIKLLSNTHFNIASPFLNEGRAQKAVTLSSEIIWQEKEKMSDPAANTVSGYERLKVAKDGWKAPKHRMESQANHVFTILNPKASKILTVQLEAEQGTVSSLENMSIECDEDTVISWTAIPMDYYNGNVKDVKSLYLILKLKEGRKYVRIYYKFEDKASKTVVRGNIAIGGDEWGANSSLPGNITLNSKDKTMQVVISNNNEDLGKIKAVIVDGREIGNTQFLKQSIKYADKECFFAPKGFVKVEIGGNGEGYAVIGEIHVPGEIEAGSYRLDIISTEVTDGIIIHSDVKYPYTDRKDKIPSEDGFLRCIDNNWQEVKSLEITPLLKDGISVDKRNFMGDYCSYRLNDFRNSIEDNKNLSSFNHHLTAGFIGVHDSTTGLAIVNPRQVLGSMALCPMRLETEETQVVKLNPFGTYAGPQRKYPSRTNGSVAKIYDMTPQAKSLAPSYNGVRENSLLAIYGFTCQSLSQAMLDEMARFADGALVTEDKKGNLHAFEGDNVEIRVSEPVIKASSDSRKVTEIYEDVSEKLMMAQAGISAALQFIKYKH